MKDTRSVQNIIAINNETKIYKKTTDEIIDLKDRKIQKDVNYLKNHITKEGCEKSP